MKKIYNAPELSVVKMQTQAFLAASGEQTLSVGSSTSTGFADGHGSDDEW